ncbi:signal recognition particle receptor subunit alpha, partial [bacterium]|nr:signal recognition particle receptor subunit alpha [bacterium]
MFQELTSRLGGALRKLSGPERLTEQNVKDVLREVRLALLEADVNYQVAKAFVARVGESAAGQRVWDSLTPDQQVVKLVRDEMVALL